MIEALQPVAKSVFLAENVTLNHQTATINVSGIFNSLRPVMANPFPYVHREFCVFAQLVGGIGEVTLNVEIVSARTDEIVYSFPVQRLAFSNRHQILAACFRIHNCPFPEAGVYFVALYCNNVFVDDRVLHIQPAGEFS